MAGRYVHDGLVLVLRRARGTRRGRGVTEPLTVWIGCPRNDRDERAERGQCAENGRFTVAEAGLQGGVVTRVVAADAIDHAATVEDGAKRCGAVVVRAERQLENWF